MLSGTVPARVLFAVRASGGLLMYRKAVKDEAAILIQDHGAVAYDMARKAMREARRRRNGRLERFLAKVALEVSRREGREVGVDTATRYLE